MIAYRAQQMETRKFGEGKTRKLDNPKFKEEEEALRKRFTEQVKLEEARFRQWEQRVDPVKIILIIAYCRTR
jgi:cell division control protein 12